MKSSFNRIITFISWLIIVYIFSFFFYEVIRKTYLKYVIKKDYVEVKGCIMKKERLGGRNGRYEVEYKFESNGKIIFGNDYISRFDRRNIGDTITLLYSRDNPNLNIVKE